MSNIGQKIGYFSLNILVEGLLNSRPRVSLQSLLDLLFPDPPVPPELYCCCCCYCWCPPFFDIPRNCETLFRQKTIKKTRTFHGGVWKFTKIRETPIFDIDFCQGIRKSERFLPKIMIFNVFSRIVSFEDGFDKNKSKKSNIRPPELSLNAPEAKCRVKPRFDDENVWNL